jgi:integrase/recombinase XerC
VADPSFPLVAVPAAAPAPAPIADPQSLLAAFLSGRKATTLRAYRQDLAAFAAFLGAPYAEDAAKQLLARGPGPANSLALAFRSHMLDAGLSPATVNRRLAALRSLVKLARTVGMVHWHLDVEGVRDEPLRDSRGPGTDAMRELLARLSRRGGAKAARDAALVRLLFDLGLRRAEAVALDLADLDPAVSAVMVLGKGRRIKERLTLPGPTRKAVAAWLDYRGRRPGPLFVRLDPGRPGQDLRRLSGAAVYEVVRRLGEEAGLRVRPHGLRHSAITEALELTGGDVRAVQRFSRHRDVRVVQRYDDCRRDLAGDVARQLAEGTG